MRNPPRLVAAGRLLDIEGSPDVPSRRRRLTLWLRLACEPLVVGGSFLQLPIATVVVSRRMRR